VTNAAIYYQHEAFDTSAPKLMGRQAAGEGFLAGFARHGGVERLLAYARTRREFDEFRRQVGAGRECAWIPHGDAQALAAAGTLFMYAPGLSGLAWQRSCAGAAAWSCVGLTHTISSDRVMDEFGAMLTAPLESWDALICTSTAVRRTVDGVLERYGAWLAERFAAPPPRARFELPVIPLGVDCDAFARYASLRADARHTLRLGPDDVAFLFVGRLSYHAKAHPLPMYLGLQAAAQRTHKRLVLVLCGYFFNDAIKEQFLEGAKRFCPSVRVIQAEGRNAEMRAGAWAAADVFTSLSDNIQESFGLTPVEAMAAGLPAVVSDWDGYRDTVLEGETGFCVPTAMPEAGAGAEFALGYLAGADTYDAYIGQVSQCTAVDVAAATEAYVRLAESPELRQRLGDAGRARARRVYDWSVIIPAYQALWRELAERRCAHAPMGGRPFPLRGDPFEVFAAFPTHAIGAATLVERAAAEPLRETERIAASGMNNVALRHLLGRAELEQLFAALPSGKRVAVAELAGLFPPDRRTVLLRTLGWLAKGRVDAIMPGSL
jgi:glycosyltransferase involved in cell wall biosynthesis